MKYFNIQKQILKKTFKFTNYEWKSALLDLISFALYFILFLIVAGIILFNSYQTSIFEQNYAGLIEENSLSNDYRTEIAKSYINVLYDLFALIIFSILALFILSFLGGSFIKILQYKFLSKKSKLKLKQYFNIVLRTIRNTLPLFGVFLVLFFILPLIFGLQLWLILLILIFTIFYFFALPILRILSLRHKRFKIVWKTFFKIIIPKNALFYSPIIKITVLIFIILSFVIVYIHELVTTQAINILISIIYLLLLIFVFVFLRKYLYYTTLYIEKFLIKDGGNKKKQ